MLGCLLEVLKSMIKLPKKICALHKLCFGRSYIAVGCESDESAIPIEEGIFKQKLKKKLYIDRLTKM